VIPQDGRRLGIGRRADEQQDPVQWSHARLGLGDQGVCQKMRKVGHISFRPEHFATQNPRHRQGNLDHFLEQLFLGTEIPVDEHGRHAGVLGDFPDAGAVVAAPRERQLRRLENGLPCGHGVSPSFFGLTRGRVRIGLLVHGALLQEVVRHSCRECCIRRSAGFAVTCWEAYAFCPRESMKSMPDDAGKGVKKNGPGAVCRVLRLCCIWCLKFCYYIVFIYINMKPGISKM